MTVWLVDKTEPSSSVPSGPMVILKVRTNEQAPLEWAQSTGDQGLALLVLAKRKGDAGMAKTAVEKIEIAYTTAQGGGDKSHAAYYGAHLTEARALLGQLGKPR